MSKVITISLVDKIIPHENADKLEIAIIEGWECVVPKGQYKVGDRVMYFPPEVMITEEVATKLGVAKYLKFKMVKSPSGEEVSAGRTKTVKIRNIVSMGIVTTVPKSLTQSPVGTECNEYYGAWEYEAPDELETSRPKDGAGSPKSKRSEMGTPVPQAPLFPNVVNILKRHKAFVGQWIAATEKLHGSNVGIGYVNVGNHQIIVVNSRNNRRKIPVIKYRLIEKLFVMGRNKSAGRPTLYNIFDKLYRLYAKTKLGTYYPSCNECLDRYSKELSFDYGPNFRGSVFSSFEIIKSDRYWGPVENYELWKTLPKMSQNNDLVLYGEITGQFKGFDYGSPTPQFFVFDVNINGKMQSHDAMIRICSDHLITTVPTIYIGEYDLDVLKKIVNGQSMLGNHIKEGLVIRLVDGSGPRLKLLSPEYLVKRDADLVPDQKDD